MVGTCEHNITTIFFSRFFCLTAKRGEVCNPARTDRQTTGDGENGMGWDGDGSDDSQLHRLTVLRRGRTDGGRQLTGRLAGKGMRRRAEYRNTSSGI